MLKNMARILVIFLLNISFCTFAFAAEPGTPMEERTGETAVVYFTHDLSAEGLKRIYSKLSDNISGKVAIKLHTGEKNGPNILPREWVKALQSTIPNSNIVETNTYYKGDRYTTEDHRQTLAINGWDFCSVDIMDENGITWLPVNGGIIFKEMAMGKSITDYESMLVLTHFKGHTMGGFGGSNKNIGIGCADGRVGKALIHTGSDANEWGIAQKQWQINEEPFMERMTESSKAVADFFGKHIIYVNVLRNMSIDCDCMGVYAAPVTLPDVGIFASTDILAVDQASVDKVYELFAEGHSHDLKERIESRKGLRQLSYMKELGMGCDKYVIINIDEE